MGNSSSTPSNKERRRSNRLSHRLSKPLTDPTSLANLRIPSALRSESTVRPPSSAQDPQLPANSTAEIACADDPAANHAVEQKPQSAPNLGRRQSTQEPKIRSAFGSFIGGIPDRLSRSKSTLSRVPVSSSREPKDLDNADCSPLSFVPEWEPMVSDPSSQHVQEADYATPDSSVIRTDPEESPPGRFYDKQFVTSRRKSLRTPGVATRTHGKGSSVSEYHNNPYGEYSQSSDPIDWPQNYQDKLSHRRVTSPQPRVSTPTQLVYGQLGGLKPGTLRITNGYPRSTTPNDREQRKIANQLSNNDTNNNKTFQEPVNLPPQEAYTSQPNLSSHGADEEAAGLGLQFTPQAHPRIAELRNLHQTLPDNCVRTDFQNDKPPDSPALFQFPPDGTKEQLSSPSEEFSSRFLDSPFSFELSSTPITIPMVEPDDKSFEDEGVDISHENNEYQTPSFEQPDNGPGEDKIGSLRERYEQPLKKADSGYSSATSAHSRRNNSHSGRLTIRTPGECESYSDKVTSWNSVGSNDDYRDSWQPHLDATLPENDVISQHSITNDRQFNINHTARRASHSRQRDNSVRISNFSRRPSLEADSSRVSFQDPFSTRHLPHGHIHRSATMHHPGTFQSPTSQTPLELTASCGCVLRFHDLNSSHDIPSHCPDEAGIRPRRISAPASASRPFRTDQNVQGAQNMYSCDCAMPPNSNFPPSHPPKAGKLTHRRRSSATRGPPPPANACISPYLQGTAPERRQSTDTMRVRQPVGASSDSQLWKPKSFTSLKSRSSRSVYREQPIASKAPSIWGEDTTIVYSDNATGSSLFGETAHSPQREQDSIPPMPPLPTDIRTKRSVTQQLGLSNTNRASNSMRGLQPRKLVKPQKGSCRHPNDSRVMVNGAF